jgi:ethanolamine utilization protein EutQ (cupin superfamily)
MKNIFLFTFCLVLQAISAQPALISWEVKEGSKGEDYFTKNIQLSNGNLAAIGNLTASDGLKHYGNLFIIDFSTGKMIKKVTYGNQNDVFLNDLIELPDGNIFLIGYSHFNKTNYPLLIKTDASGNKLMEKILPIADGSILTSIHDDQETGFYLTATTMNGDVFLIHLNKEIEVNWKKVISSGPYGELKKVSVGPNKSIYVGGNTKKGGGQNPGDVWISSLDKNGNELWRKSFGGKLWEELNDLICLPDGSILFCGETNSLGNGKQDFWLVKLNNNGFLQWERTYGGRETDIGKSILPLFNGNFWLAGSSLSLLNKKGATKFAARIIEIDPSGNLQWEADYGGDNNEDINHLCQIHDGSILFSGWIETNTPNIKDAWMIRFPAPEMNRLLAKGNLRLKESKIWLNTPDGLLKPNVQSYLSFQLNNQEANQIENIRIDVNKIDGQKGIHINQTVFIQPLQPNVNKQINIPITSEENIETKDNLLEIKVYSGADLIKTVSGTVKSLNPKAANLRFVQTKTEKEGVDEFSPQTLTAEIQNDGDLPAAEVQVNFILPKGILALTATDVKLGTINSKSLKRATFRFQKTVQFEGNEVAIQINAIDNQLTNISKTVSTRFDVISVNQSSNIIVFNNPKASQKRTDWNNPTFKLEAMFGTTGNNLKLGDAVVKINGIIPERSKMDEEKLTPPASVSQGNAMNFYDYENVIALSEGENRILIELVTPNGVIQSNEMIINYKPKQPNLHVLSVGIPHRDLKYTTIDAENFANAFLNQTGMEKVFNKIYVEKKNTKENTRNLDIRAAMEDLKRRYSTDLIGGKINREDVLILFISSHGKTDDNNDFKILASDYDTYGDVSNIDYKRDILDILNQIDCKKFVFIDACHSGSAQGARLINQARFALEEINNAYPGLNVLTSSQVDELSYEDDSWGNGAFTEAILEAFSGKITASGLNPDPDGDKIIRFGELYDFLQKRVPSMVFEKKKSKQMPAKMSKGLGDNIPLFILY